MKKIKVLLIISIAVNVLLVGQLGFSKRGAILSRLNKVLDTKTVVSENQLKSMNNTSIPMFVDTCSRNNGKTFKILVLGNSLSYHGIVKEIGWNHISGMAATTKEKDFAHLLFKKIEKKLPDRNVCLRISNFANFERNPKSLTEMSIDSLINYQPDIVVFQLGENVSLKEKESLLLFEKNYIELINLFKKNRNPLIICTTTFFPSLPKNKTIEKVTLSTNSYLVDLSHLPLLEAENYAKDEKDYLGNKADWKNDGIGVHPGDLGMENIATQIYITINATISNWGKLN